jgi:hypothetical protein
MDHRPWRLVKERIFDGCSLVRSRLILPNPTLMCQWIKLFWKGFFGVQGLLCLQSCTPTEKPSTLNNERRRDPPTSHWKEGDGSVQILSYSPPSPNFGLSKGLPFFITSWTFWLVPNLWGNSNPAASVCSCFGLVFRSQFKKRSIPYSSDALCTLWHLISCSNGVEQEDVRLRVFERIKHSFNLFQNK